MHLIVSLYLQRRAILVSCFVRPSGSHLREYSPPTPCAVLFPQESLVPVTKDTCLSHIAAFALLGEGASPHRLSPGRPKTRITGLRASTSLGDLAHLNFLPPRRLFKTWTDLARVSFGYAPSGSL